VARQAYGWQKPETSEFPIALSGEADQGRIIRVPVHVVEAQNKVFAAQRRLEQHSGREPTLEEIANEIGIRPEKVREITRTTQVPVSLETPSGEGGGSLLGELIEDQAAIEPLDSQKLCDVVE
jgi:RNA polymerase primary sigma factor